MRRDLVGGPGSADHFRRRRTVLVAVVAAVGTVAVGTVVGAVVGTVVVVAVGVVAGVVGVAAGVVVVADAAGGNDVAGFLRRPSRFGGSAVSQVGRLLPPAVRAAYVEEWQGWLYDLRERGEPWHRRLVEMLSIVFVAAPWLAVTSRLGKRKVVDR